MKSGDVQAEILGENKWANAGLNGTVHALLTIDRPVRVEVSIDADWSLVVLVFEGLEKKDGEQPIAKLGCGAVPDTNWISHADGSMTILPRDNKKGN